jgi:hypothetical protein
MEELGTLEDRVDAVGASIAKAVSEVLNPDHDADPFVRKYPFVA